MYKSKDAAPLIKKSFEIIWKQKITWKHSLKMYKSKDLAPLIKKSFEIIWKQKEMWKDSLDMYKSKDPAPLIKKSFEIRNFVISNFSKMQPPLNARKSHCVKSVRIRSYSGPYFPAFGLNTERCEVFHRIQSKYGKIRTRITSNTDTFHAVLFVQKCRS